MKLYIMQRNTTQQNLRYEFTCHATLQLIRKPYSIQLFETFFYNYKQICFFVH
jgi:hypothetical protein